MKVMNLGKIGQIIFPMFLHLSEAWGYLVFSVVIIYFMFPWTYDLLCIVTEYAEEYIQLFVRRSMPNLSLKNVS